MQTRSKIWTFAAVAFVGFRNHAAVASSDVTASAHAAAPAVQHLSIVPADAFAPIDPRWHPLTSDN